MRINQIRTIFCEFVSTWTDLLGKQTILVSQKGFVYFWNGTINRVFISN